jgi:HPt (histidine-containing phosphotransfer) domain-containing protein
MTDTQIIDPQALERLREWGGEKLAGQMVRLFLKNSGTRMDQIRAGVAGSDLQETERGAHSLKSSAANVGAETLRAMATRMESAALDESVDEARNLLPELETAYESAMKELATIEKGLPE